MFAFTVGIDGFTTGAAAIAAALKKRGSVVYFLGLLYGWVSADGIWCKKHYGLTKGSV